MALSAAALNFLTFVGTFLNQCQLYDRTGYQTACNQNTQQNYDFIIVGGGSAGTTLASRLTENPRWKVLLIEAGGVPSQLSEAPATFLALQGSPEDWQFKTELGNHCLGFKDQKCSIPQGKALGGGSTINAMLAVNANKRDFDDWYNLGNRNWSYDAVKPYLDKAFNQMQTSTYESIMPTRTMLLGAATELNIPINNSDVHIKYEDIHLTIKDNQRHNTAKAYIVSANKRPNLCVMTNTVVSRILFQRRNGPKAIGVQLQNGKRLFATNEIIISAGAVNSPKLLMLSGLGDRVTLKRLGIPLLKHLPGVGQNFMDHIMYPGYLIKFPQMPIEADINMFLDLYCQTKQGPIGEIDIGEVVGWINTRNDSEYPDIQYMHMTMLKKDKFLVPAYISKMGFNDISGDSIFAENQENTMMTALPILAKPKSRGFITLKSDNVNDAPLIHPGYLTEEHDMETLLGGIKHLNRMLATKAFEGAELVKIDIPNCNGLEFNTDDYWRCCLRNFATTLYHPTGTCRMGSRNDEMSVVDEDLNVHGVQSLRVVDSSIMPMIVTGNTNLPVITIAERTADRIKSCY